MTWPLARLRLPSLRVKTPPLRLNTIPLRVTVLVTVLLLAAPTAVLLRMPRPRAEGLGRLLPHAGLLQSFPAAPERQPPPLWQQRLDAATAQQLWRQQRQLWWQFWSHDQAGGAYLVMPLPRQIRVGAQPAPPHSLQIDGLLVVSSGPLAQRFLEDQLVQSSRRQQGLQQRCLEMLEREPGAYWSSQGLEAMAGPIAPLLQALQEGCLALELVPGELLVSGEAGSARSARSAVSAAEPPPDSPPANSPPADSQPPDSPPANSAPLAAAVELPEPIGEGLLLRLSGRSLDPLLAGLLSREEVREATSSVYGLGDAELALLQGTPFELRLRPLLAGPFQAGLELLLPVKANPAAWIAILDALSERLRVRGLMDDSVMAGSGELVSITWRDEQAREVGGWRWYSAPGQPLQLLLFLGPEPDAPPEEEDISLRPTAEQPLLSLQARPRDLAALNLLPGQLPLPLLQARQLLLVAEAAPAGGTISRLLGRLQLGELLPIRPVVPAPSEEPFPELPDQEP